MALKMNFILIVLSDGYNSVPLMVGMMDLLASALGSYPFVLSTLITQSFQSYYKVKKKSIHIDMTLRFLVGM